MSRLHPYQELALSHVLDNPRCALWMEMGLGKTRPTLRAIEALLDSCDARRALVVAPLRVAASAWPAEVRKWGLRLRIRSIMGSQQARISAAESEDADLYLINYENLTWLVDRYQDAWKWDLVILDESSKMKSRDAKRWKSLTKVYDQIARLVELTGTPSANGLIDLWAQIYFLDRGKRLGRSITRFRERWFDSDFWGYKFTPKPGAEAEIRAAVSDLVLTLRMEDYLSLPDLVPVNVQVTLPNPARRVYDRLEKEMFAELQKGEVTAISAAVLANKCRQAASGALYLDGREGAWEGLHDAKIQALADIVDEAQGEPLLVAYNYRSELERLQKAFPRARVLDKNPGTVDDWNAGKIEMLLAHPQSAGHGLNLQSGGRLIVWFTLDWSLELYQQFNARLHRQGQTKPVFVYHLLATDTVDELVLERLHSKRSVQDVLLDGLKIKNPEKKA